MIDRILLFGASGDLAGRFLFPALAELLEKGQLPDAFELTGAARHDWDDDAFRRHVSDRLQEFGGDIRSDARDALLRRLRFRKLDIGGEGAAADIRPIVQGDRPIAAYLALPPNLFVSAVKALHAAGLPEGSRIVLEKPFGESLESAKQLNALLARVTGAAGESALFRVDHVLGLATVHNLVGFRLANRVFEPAWNSAHIEQIDILWEETIALEGRAGYFDRNGALKDVMQNHMLQILALIAMEPPTSLSEHDLRDRKAEVLRAVRPPSEDEMTTRTRRARYTAGKLASTGDASGEHVPDYTKENGVDPKRCTETWAEVMLMLDNWRWTGTRFVLRAGKALHRRRKGVIVHFRPVPRLAFGDDAPRPPHNEMRIGLDGPESLTLHLTGSAPGPPLDLRPLIMTAQLPATEQRAYSTVFLDVLTGDCTLSIRGDEAEQQWRIMEPVIGAWADDRVPLEEYEAGSSGPRPRASMHHLPTKQPR